MLHSCFERKNDKVLVSNIVSNLTPYHFYEKNIEVFQ